VRSGEPLTRARLLSWTAALVASLALSVLMGVAWGTGSLTLADLRPGGAPLSEQARAVFFDVRLPRVLAAAVLGGALSVAGVVFQALLRNPLADPYVLGVSGGASIGGVLALLFGLGGATSLLGELAVPAFAFLGALGALLLIEWVATVGGKLTVYTVLLTGAIFNAFSAALIYFIQTIASLEQLHAIVFYLMGSVPLLGYRGVGLLAAASLLATVALLAMARDYNALTIGEEGAAQLGVNVEGIKRRTFVLGSLLTGLAVSVAGLIGFVGLVVPHLLRLLLGPDHRLLLPAAFFGGGSFLVLADLIARVAVAPGELPVGVVTALVGGPFFLTLLRRRGARYELS
jgi:iron complex transport system permease protein